MRAALRMPARQRAARSAEAACSPVRRGCASPLPLLGPRHHRNAQEAKEAGSGCNASACTFLAKVSSVTDLSPQRSSSHGDARNQAGSSAVSSVSQPTGTARARRGPCIGLCSPSQMSRQRVAELRPKAKPERGLRYTFEYTYARQTEAFGL